MKKFILFAIIAFLSIPQLVMAIDRPVDVFQCNPSTLKEGCDGKCQMAGFKESTPNSRCPVWENNKLKTKGFFKFEY